MQPNPKTQREWWSGTCDGVLWKCLNREGGSGEKTKWEKDEFAADRRARTTEGMESSHSGRLMILPEGHRRRWHGWAEHVLTRDHARRISRVLLQWNWSQQWLTGIQWALIYLKNLNVVKDASDGILRLTSVTWVVFVRVSALYCCLLVGDFVGSHCSPSQRPVIASRYDIDRVIRHVKEAICLRKPQGRSVDWIQNRPVISIRFFQLCN